MSWYHLHNNPDTMVEIGNLKGDIYRGRYADQSDETIENVIANRQLLIQGMAKMVEDFKAGRPIYAKIHSGARAGSIAKIERDCLQLRNISSVPKGPAYNIIRQGTLPTDPNIFIRESKSGFMGIREPNLLEIYMMEWIEQDGSKTLRYEFDGRKPVATNWGDQAGLEILPNHVGPTVYLFAKKPPKTEEEKAKKVDLLPCVPLDMFGNELAIGDMFIYSRRDELVIARLKRTHTSGFITAETILDKKEVRLQGEVSSHATKTGQHNPALMKFDKNEVLSTKLMMEKLKR